MPITTGNGACTTRLRVAYACVRQEPQHVDNHIYRVAKYKCVGAGTLIVLAGCVLSVIKEAFNSQAVKTVSNDSFLFHMTYEYV